MRRSLSSVLSVGQQVLICILIALALRTAVPGQSSQSLPILVYHQLRVSGNDPADAPDAISLRRFEAQMRYLHSQGYTTLSMDDVIRFLKGEPFPAKIVAIHFDDGWKSALQAIPILNQYGFKASFWIIAGKGIGWPHMDWDEVHALAENSNFDIFSHTMTHPWKANDTLLDWINNRVPGKGLEEVNWELTESRRVLEEKLGKPVAYLAWPSGFYNDSLIALAQKAGYSALLTIDDGLNHPGDDALRIHRTMIHGGCDDQVFGEILVDGKYRNCVPASGSSLHGWLQGPGQHLASIRLE
jgi:peptidoglycan/xylan/chitin deacetylase (PgdA/CDA1 family)